MNITPARSIVGFLIPVLLTMGCSTVSTLTGGRDARWVESTLERLTLEEKVAQLMVFWTPGRYFSENSDQWDELTRLTKERKLGGFYFSLGDVYEFAVQANRLQAMADVPLLLASDFEYGAGMRVRHSTTFPRAMAMGAARDPQLVYAMAKAVAREGRAMGIHHNYAPTADVNTNPKNPVINTRSFGSDVGLVTGMSVAFVKGTQDGGMLATVKHFPGHGDTDVDTHLGLSILTFDRSRLDSLELPPFVASINAGVKSVMIGHLAATAFDTGGAIPATLSSSVTTALLRGQLGYDGLIVTDALRMQAVADKYSPGEDAVLAFQAGADIILLPQDVDLAIDAIVAAIKSGGISVARLDASVRKILQTKQDFGLDVQRMVDVDNVARVVGSREHQLLALDIARKAVTVLGNKNGVLPLSRGDRRTALDLVVSDSENPSDGRQFHQELRSRHPRMDFARIDPRSNAIEYDTAYARAQRAELIIVQLHLYTRSGEMSGFVDSTLAAFMNKVLDLGKPVVAVAFGNPYVVLEFPRVDAYVCLYSGADVMQQAGAEVLFAEVPAAGLLPVEIPGVFAYGEGVRYPKMALREGTAAEAGFNPDLPAKVDDIIEKAVMDSAFPGAVVLAARNGIIAHHKGYGGYDYGRYAKRVSPNTIYDLASVTKVIATTGAVMRLLDEGRIRLDDPVVNYLPAFGQNGKERITIYNLMVHNSGLPGWRRFYDFCTDAPCVVDSIFASRLAYTTGDSMVYSDLGLITMGKLVERVSGVGLDVFMDSLFFRPLGMRSTMFNPPPRFRDRITPTEVDTFWKRTGEAVRGRVHDENAATLGGVSGHAGLFATASDLAVYVQMLLNGGTYGGIRYLNESTVREFTRRQSPMSSRGIGWDTKSSNRSFSGTLTSMSTFLHTGFTGTSVVCDPGKNIVVVFLTNRVYPTRNTSKIFGVRPRLHDAILGAIE